MVVKRRLDIPEPRGIENQDGTSKNFEFPSLQMPPSNLGQFKAQRPLHTSDTIVPSPMILREMIRRLINNDPQEQVPQPNSNQTAPQK